MPLKDAERYDGYRFTDAVLLAEAPALAARERSATADLLVRMAQIDLRKLYRNAGYPSMAAYAFGALRLAENEAWRRIQAARAGLRFPILFEALAESRIHLTAINLLAPYLNSDNIEDLVVAVTHRGKAKILLLLAERFPAPETLAVIPVVSPIPVPTQMLASRSWTSAAGLAEPTASNDPVPAPAHVAGQVALNDPLPSPAKVARQVALNDPLPSPAKVGGWSAEPHWEPRSARRPIPVGPRKFRVEFTIDDEENELLERAQALLSHRHPSAGAKETFIIALTALVRTLEKKRFAATTRPRMPREQKARAQPETRAGAATQS